jgi:HIRAN domain-containing protein
MIYSWISAEFLAGPPGYCEGERVTGPFFPTETLADLHAKANVERESRSVSHVRTPTSSYTISTYEDDRALFQHIYVRVVGLKYHDSPPSFAKDIRLAEEDDNPYDDQAIAAYADDVKFGYLTRQDARFFRALKDYPIKEIYIKRRRDTYYELGLEF